jgi:hypothetical protein
VLGRIGRECLRRAPSYDPGLSIMQYFTYLSSIDEIISLSKGVIYPEMTGPQACFEE